MNKSRLLREEDIIRAVDKHTNDDGNLDNDITCILEEVPDILDDCEIKLEGNKGSCLLNPKVFIFQADSDMETSVQIQEILYKQFKSGCVVIPRGIKLLTTQELYNR